MTLDTLQPGRLVALRAAAMFDGVGSALVAGPLVVIAGSVIVAVRGPAGPVPPGASVIDLGGLTLMPGLVDTHMHLCFDPATRSATSRKPMTTCCAGRWRRRPGGRSARG